MTPLRALRGIALIGLVAGTLDISAACTNFFLTAHKNPVRVLYYVASGLIGPSALNGGAAMAALGLFIHYCIAYSWTLLFFLCYPIVSRYSTNRAANGLVYGVVVWLCMNLVVLPRTQVPQFTQKPLQQAIQILTLMIMIGLPIAYMTEHDYREAHRAESLERPRLTRP